MNDISNEDYFGFWALTDEWFFNMKASLEISNSRFIYDFWTDSGGIVKLEGSVSFKVHLLVLEQEGERTHQSLSHYWQVIKYDGEIYGLFPLDALSIVFVRDESITSRMFGFVSKTKPNDWPSGNIKIRRYSDNNE